ncbi:MAG: hypothetical protein JWL85_773 [Candidatus Saccharibacteria bacterium]|nr:hypothetical protein [Candidatus Saccharibacteria bacterium]
MRWFRKKPAPNVNISTDGDCMIQYYKISQLFGYKQFNQNVLVTKVIVRIGNFQFYPGAEINRGINVDGLDLFFLMTMNRTVKVDYDPNSKIYQIIGVQNG